MRELAQVGNRAGADLALEPTPPRCEVNIYVRWFSIVLFFSYHKGTLKPTRHIGRSEFYLCSFKTQTKIIIPLVEENCTILLSVNFIATVTVKYKDDK